MGRKIWSRTKIKLDEEIKKDERLKQREQLRNAINQEKDQSLQKELFSRLEAFEVDQRKKNSLIHEQNVPTYPFL